MSTEDRESPQPTQQSDELPETSLESVSGGIIGDCTGGTWPTKPLIPPCTLPPIRIIDTVSE
jgi:hypothetical protein